MYTPALGVPIFAVSGQAMGFSRAGIGVFVIAALRFLGVGIGGFVIAALGFLSVGIGVFVVAALVFLSVGIGVFCGRGIGVFECRWILAIWALVPP